MANAENSKILYTTVRQEASAEFTEKKSVFIGHAKPVKSDAEAMEFVAKIKEKYKDARHNCYAYYLNSGVLARYSDDNEPQGTAGIPILEVIKKSGVNDCVVVVTRYFGGILLGAGGLVRAYSTAAGLALEAAGIVTYEEYESFSLSCDYGEYNKINFELECVNAIIDKCDFLENVKLEFAVKSEISDIICKKISELSGGKLAPVSTGKRFDCSP